MARRKISAPLSPTPDGAASSSRSPSTPTRVAMTPLTSDASVAGGEVDACDIPVMSVEGDQQPPSVESLNNNDPYFTWRTPSSIAPSITYTPPLSTRHGSRASGTPILGEGSSGLTPSFRLALSRSLIPKSTEAFNLLAMQAAISDAAVQTPGSPDASPEREHLSPVPTPVSGHRRRRSSNAVRQPHVVSDEEPPTDRFYQPVFQTAFQRTKNLMADLSNVLASGELHQEQDSKMKKLYEEVLKLSAFQCPSTRTVGFVGDSGVGKSSLINSLLDIQGLARASAGGVACTCVVTEFVYHSFPNFDIEVQYFAREELEKELSELLEAYRHYHLSYDELNADEREAYGEKARVAEDTLQAMFRIQLREGHGFLKSLDEQSALRRLMSWVDNSPHSTTARETLNDAESCSRRLMELTSDLGSVDQPAMWPFIRKIRVRSNAHILSKGLILVDLPGLRDIDSARRRITERYIRECDEIFAVCNIIRAITDEGVKAVIELADKASLSNVGIVCTRSDEIPADEAEKDWKDTRAEMVSRGRVAIRTADLDLARIKDEIKEYDDLGDLEDEEKDAYLRLQRRAQETRKRLAQRQFELKRFLVSTRNEIVSNDLRELYEDRIPGDQLAVFCVSNKDYWDHRPLPEDQSRDILVLSGIIQLRKHCISIVSESQLQAATLYMEQKIPALLDSLQLWVQSGSGSLSVERKQVIRDTLSKVEKKLQKGLIGPESGIHRRVMKRMFDEHITQHQQTDVWVEGAAEAADNWHGWHHGSYAAFCRQFGNHYTATAGRHNWNEEAIDPMASSMRPRWKELCKEFADQGRNAITMTGAVFDESTDLLEATDGLDEAQFDTLSAAVINQWNLLEAELEDVFQNIGTDLRKLEVDAFSGIVTSFIGQAMNSSYRACNRESGSGSDRRRKDIIETRLQSEDIFIEMQLQLKTRFKLIADDLKEKQASIQTRYFEAVKENLDMLRDKNIIRESESDPAFRKRVEDQVCRIKAALGNISSVLAAQL